MSEVITTEHVESEGYRKMISQEGLPKGARFLTVADWPHCSEYIKKCKKDPEHFHFGQAFQPDGTPYPYNPIGGVWAIFAIGEGA